MQGMKATRIKRVKEVMIRGISVERGNFSYYAGIPRGGEDGELIHYKPLVNLA